MSFARKAQPLTPNPGPRQPIHITARPAPPADPSSPDYSLLPGTPTASVPATSDEEVHATLRRASDSQQRATARQVQQTAAERALARVQQEDVVETEEVKDQAIGRIQEQRALNLLRDTFNGKVQFDSDPQNPDRTELAQEFKRVAATNCAYVQILDRLNERRGLVNPTEREDFIRRYAARIYHGDHWKRGFNGPVKEDGAGWKILGFLWNARPFGKHYFFNPRAETNLTPEQVRAAIQVQTQSALNEIIPAPENPMSRTESPSMSSRSLSKSGSRSS